jgi:hypothetical protein
VLNCVIESGASARPDQTPTAQGLENSEQTQAHQHQADSKIEVGHDNPGDEQDRTGNPASHPAVEANIAIEEAHSGVSPA